MPINIILSVQSMNNSFVDSAPSGTWGGSINTVTETFVNAFYQGGFLNWGGYDNQLVNSPFFNQPYVGYNTNWGGAISNGLDNTFQNTNYTGYNTNWGSNIFDIQESLFDVDINSVIDHPKDQNIYFKLKGWNPLTLGYESWVVSENITGRPELFDPGRVPPNVERDVFKTPPSGNRLVNIVIVSRWIE